MYANGPVNQSVTNDTWTTAALAAAEKADVILYFGGIDNSIEREGFDRQIITWPEAQIELIEKLSSLGKPVVLSQLGTQIDNTAWLNSDNISAILWTGYPSQDGGTAALDIITGKVAPAGRLPITQYPANYVNEVPIVDQSLRPSNKSPGRTYKWFDGAVQPYGYGLHYTKFQAKFTSRPNQRIQISQLQRSCHQQYADLCDGVSVNIRVSNMGHKVTSDFVALAFLAGQYGPKPYPIKELAAYTRLKNIRSGSSASATLSMTLGNLARRDTNGNLVLYPGEYSVLLDVPTQATYKFTLEGHPWVLDHFPQPPATPQEATNGCDYCVPQTDLSGPLTGQ